MPSASSGKLKRRANVKKDGVSIPPSERTVNEKTHGVAWFADRQGSGNSTDQMVRPIHRKEQVFICNRDNTEKGGWT